MSEAAELHHGDAGGDVAGVSLAPNYRPTDFPDSVPDKTARTNAGWAPSMIIHRRDASSRSRGSWRLHHRRRWTPSETGNQPAIEPPPRPLELTDNGSRLPNRATTSLNHQLLAPSPVLTAIRVRSDVGSPVTTQIPGSSPAMNAVRRTLTVVIRQPYAWSNRRGSNR